MDVVHLNELDGCNDDISSSGCNNCKESKKVSLHSYKRKDSVKDNDDIENNSAEQNNDSNDDEDDDDDDDKQEEESEKASIDEIKEIEKQMNSKGSYSVIKALSKGMMDIALLSANGNQLRLVLSYGTNSSTYMIALCLIILSLVLQVCVGVGLILKATILKRSNKQTEMKMLLFVGVFFITFINILITALTTTDSKQKEGE